MSDSDSLQIVCPSCGAVNRVPAERLSDQPICGKCQAPLFAGEISANDEMLDRLIEKSDLPVIVDFWAPWCGPCLAFAPTYEALAEEMAGKMVFCKVNTDENQQGMTRLQVRGFPTFIIFKQGKEVARIAGALPKPQFVQWIQSSLA